MCLCANVCLRAYVRVCVCLLRNSCYSLDTETAQRRSTINESGYPGAERRGAAPILDRRQRQPDTGARPPPRTYPELRVSGSAADTEKSAKLVAGDGGLSQLRRSSGSPSTDTANDGYLARDQHIHDQARYSSRIYIYIYILYLYTQ